MKKQSIYRPRNREHKSRNISISQAAECRHMWSGGVCLKCGASQTDSAPDRNREKLKEEIYEEQNH